MKLIFTRIKTRSWNFNFKLFLWIYWFTYTRLVWFQIFVIIIKNILTWLNIIAPFWQCSRKILCPNHNRIKDNFHQKYKIFWENWLRVIFRINLLTYLKNNSKFQTYYLLIPSFFVQRFRAKTARVCGKVNKDSSWRPKTELDCSFWKWSREINHCSNLIVHAKIWWKFQENWKKGGKSNQ